MALAVLGTTSLIESNNALSRQAFGQLSSVRTIKKAQVKSYFEDRKHDMDVLLDTVETLYQEAFSKLESVQELKRAQVEALFNRIDTDIRALARSGDLKTLYSELRHYHDEMEIGPEDPFDVASSRYELLYDLYSRYLGDYVKEYGYYDMFLVCAPHGHVMYTAAREPDMGANLGHGEFREEGLARLWRKVVETREVAIEDFSPYAPSKGQQAAFIGAPSSESGMNSWGWLNS